MNIIELFKIIGIISAVIGALFKLYSLINFRPQSRTFLKTDLEILRMIDTSHPNHGIIKEHVDAKIKDIYLPRKRGLKVYDWYAFILGIILLPIFSMWTVYLLKDGFTWWVLVTGFLAFGGFGNILDSFEEKKAENSNSSENSQDENGSKQQQ